MPLHTPTVRGPRLVRAAAIATATACIATATACIAAGAAPIVIAHDLPAPQIYTIAPSQPVSARYFDIEANKAASMRALGLYIAEQQTNRTSR